MANVRCVSCNSDNPETREMTSEEVAKIGYAPEDMRVCTVCQSLDDTLWIAGGDE